MDNSKSKKNNNPFSNIFFNKNVFFLFTSMIFLCICLALCACTQNNKNNSDINVSCLKGPTAIGATYMIDDYKMNFAVSADSIVADIASGKCDIALLPANVAANLYNKNEKIKMIDINTLGVLYGLSQNNNIKSINDLENKTVYMTGKGAVPELVFKDLLQKNNIAEDKVKIVFCSEAAEVISHILQEGDSVGIVNEPQATIAVEKYDQLNRVLDLTDDTITGVSVANTEFLKNHKDEVDNFIIKHVSSVNKVKDNSSEAANILAEHEVFENNKYLPTAISNCNICCIYGNNMADQAEKFYERIKLEQPNENFYYIK